MSGSSSVLQRLLFPHQGGIASPAMTENYSRNQQWARMGPYFTELAPHEEQQFQQWARAKGIPSDDPTYDNRGFWKGLMTGDPRARTGINPSDQTIHGPDTWKTPYHDSFSNESIYAMPDAPRWKGTDETGYSLQDKLGRIIFDERMSRQR